MPIRTAKFNSPVKDIVFSSFKMLEAVWPEARLGITWHSLANYDLETNVSVIKEAITDKSVKKNILIASFQKYIGNTDVQTLIAHMNDIVAVCDTQNMNKIAFATAIFVPSQEKSWGQAAIFNTECQKLNESMNIPRVNLHRSVMSQISAWNLTMRIRPAMFSQFQLGCGLGTHLSHEGQEHVKRYVIKVFDTVFFSNRTDP